MKLNGYKAGQASNNPQNGWMTVLAMSGACVDEITKANTIFLQVLFAELRVNLMFMTRLPHVTIFER